MMPGGCQWFTLSLALIHLALYQTGALELSHAGVASEENRLWRYLFKENSYNLKVRPLYNISEPVNLTLDVALNQIIDFNEPKMILTSEIWVRLYWRDEMLMWNASDFGGLTSIQVPARDVWLPDLYLYSSVKPSEGVFGNSNFMVAISSDGNVRWLYPTVIQSRCSVDMGLFPFDTQQCIHKFGSWSYSGHYIDIYPKGPVGDATNYINNGEWDLVDLPSRRDVKMYNCCPEPYPSVTYTYVLRRRPTYYIFNLTLPCFLITLVNLFSFLLPVESGEKISMNITTLLTVTVFMMMIADSIPPQGNVIPIIECYFGGCILLLCTSTAASVFIYRIHFKGEYGTPFPVWARRVLHGPVGRMLGRNTRSDTCASVTHLEKTKEDVLQVEPALEQAPAVDKGMLSYSNNAHVGNLYADKVHSTEVESGSSAPQSGRSAGQEWRDLAQCVDKLFFIVFSLLHVTASVFTLFYFRGESGVNGK